MPGGPYFNAHVHLELSHLRGAIAPGKPFPEWLAEIVRLKRLTMPADAESAARHALERLRSTGTVALADILSPPDYSYVPLREASERDVSFRALLFREIIRFDPLQGESAVREALDRQAECPDEPCTLTEALSPHAPYTVSAPLLRSAARLAAAHGQWLCIHAAETAEETEMMLRGRGALRDFLAPVLPWGWEAPGMRPVAWLDACGCLGPKTLLVHCNDVNDEDIALIARRGCAVVVCPGTHVYFNRDAFPLRRLLEAGVEVWLGTDSLASNEDLDMGREVMLASELSGLPLAVVEPLASAARVRRFLG